jgi:tRNA wybutosine-synthesizing protein 1
MANVPYHEEVIKFSQLLLDQLNDSYGIACEHQHSNCVLLAHKKFLIDNQWHTWIDYQKFNQLITDYYQSNGSKTFSSLDYIDLTPKWAVFGSNERGFDPDETRFRKYNKNK